MYLRVPDEIFPYTELKDIADKENRSPELIRSLPPYMITNVSEVQPDVPPSDLSKVIGIIGTWSLDSDGTYRR